VNAVLGIGCGGQFLSKHCDERPDKRFTWLTAWATGYIASIRYQQAVTDAGRYGEAP
jgi:hypothetical protein